MTAAGLLPASGFAAEVGGRTWDVLSNDALVAEDVLVVPLTADRVVWIEYERPLREDLARWKSADCLSGAHPLKKGYRVIADMLADVLERTVPVPETQPSAARWGVEVENLWDETSGCSRALIPGWYVLSFALGVLLGVWIPTIRYIYTVSFVFQTFGLFILILDALFVLTDIWQRRRGLGFFIMFGQCSLFCWMLSTFFRPGLGRIADQIVIGVPRLLGSAQFQPVLFQIVCSLMFVYLVWTRLRLTAK